MILIRHPRQFVTDFAHALPFFTCQTLTTSFAVITSFSGLRHSDGLKATFHDPSADRRPGTIEITTNSSISVKAPSLRGMLTFWRFILYSCRGGGEMAQEVWRCP